MAVYPLSGFSLIYFWLGYRRHESEGHSESKESKMDDVQSHVFSPVHQIFIFH